MSDTNPIINKKIQLEKYPGKGGWTYAIIPELPQVKRAHFGWVKVKGQIDDFVISNYKLMPLGNGKLFLPVKKEIRKKIGKEAGDWVHVILFLDDSPLEIPNELLECLADDDIAHANFFKLTEGKQKEIIDNIYSAKTDATKIQRIAAAINQLSKIKK
ncbi:MAG: YdeI/OmpD-associated family protein [Chitinophagales bacterium]|nr:DUF1905 domain-containing protein [Bacteroidota bacterium]